VLKRQIRHALDHRLPARVLSQSEMNVRLVLAAALPALKLQSQ
jgi:hypothetical protein